MISFLFVLFIGARHLSYLKEKERKLKEKKEKEAAKRIPPWEMFKRGEEATRYSKYDDKGIPTHSADGEEISKKQRKKLEKLYETQQRNYEQVHFEIFFASRISASKISIK
ncbi:Cysteine--tRNA ligase, cytoplasmic [Toxocara canis]|uniref:Cysteine--tRNA ligase, cytoplasmic n=1 Tax=Toxocara canis TaxID=6265 RepID=A0A0B2ULB2_TOXCA|nr:Cysteine--tRNA ligase, cytoplasmic [Toxocara canis]